jgi:hypothetical protein
MTPKQAMANLLLMRLDALQTAIHDTSPDDADSLTNYRIRYDEIHHLLKMFDSSAAAELRPRPLDA